MKVAIIGAGLSGAVVADQLAKHGIEVTVIEKSRGRGGRMTTKRLSWAQCDMGAQYFTARSPEFIAQVNDWQQLELIEPWQFVPHKIDQTKLVSSEDTEIRYVAKPEMNSIAKHLLKDKHVELNTRVNHITEDQGKWLLWRDNMELVGVYDWLISTIPAEQAYDLFADVEDVQGLIPKNVHAPCWAVALKTSGEVSKSLKGIFGSQQLKQTPFSEIAWIARQTTKPERHLADSNNVDIWNIHFNADYSSQHIGADAKVIQQTAFELLNELLFQNEVCQPLKLEDGYAHFWRYARLSNEYEASLKDKPHNNIVLNDRKVAIIGDWTHGGRVEGAYLSAIECVRRVSAVLDKRL